MRKRWARRVQGRVSVIFGVVPSSQYHVVVERGPPGKRIKKYQTLLRVSASESKHISLLIWYCKILVFRKFTHFKAEIMVFFQFLFWVLTKYSDIIKHNQQDATLHNDIYYYTCSTCFRRFLRPSSGAQNCIHSIVYLSSFYYFIPLA